mgnify:CR=1 FL=1
MNKRQYSSEQSGWKAKYVEIEAKFPFERQMDLDLKKLILK